MQSRNDRDDKNTIKAFCDIYDICDFGDKCDRPDSGRGKSVPVLIISLYKNIRNSTRNAVFGYLLIPLAMLKYKRDS